MTTIIQNIRSLQAKEPPLPLRWYFESTGSYPEPYLQFADKLRQDGLLDRVSSEAELEVYVAQNREELTHYLSQVFDFEPEDSFRPDSASSGSFARDLEHRDYELEPIIENIDEGCTLLSDFEDEYWDRWQETGEPPQIEGYRCIGVSVQEEPVYRENSVSTTVEPQYREAPVEITAIKCSGNQDSEDEDDEDWLLPEEVELFEVDEDPVDRLIRELNEQRTDSRFSRMGRRKKEIRGKDGVKRNYWVSTKAKQQKSVGQKRKEVVQARRVTERRESAEAVKTLISSVAGFASDSFKDDFATMSLEQQKYIAESAAKMKDSGSYSTVVDINRDNGFATFSDGKDAVSVGLQYGKKIMMDSISRAITVEIKDDDYGVFETEIPASNISLLVNDAIVTAEPLKGDVVERERNTAVARTAKEMWKSHLQNHFENGDIAYCSAAGGDTGGDRGKHREAIYKRMGFVDGDKTSVIDASLITLVDKSQKRKVDSSPSSIESVLRKVVDDEYNDWRIDEARVRLSRRKTDFVVGTWEATEQLGTSIKEKTIVEPSADGVIDSLGSTSFDYTNEDLGLLLRHQEALSNLLVDRNSFKLEHGFAPFEESDVYDEIFKRHYELLGSAIYETRRNIRNILGGYSFDSLLGNIKYAAYILPESYIEERERSNLEDKEFDTRLFLLKIREARANLRNMGVRLDSIPDKYSHINFVPPLAAQKAAAQGLEIRKAQPKSQRGGLTNKEASEEGIGSGVQRAVNLKNGDRLSPEVVHQMKAFFDRHSAFKYKHKEEPEGKARVSWLLWGGDAGYAWAKKVVAQMEAADAEEKKDSFDEREKAIARFNKKYSESITEQDLLRADSAEPVYEWVEGYQRGDSRIPGYVRYYRDRKGASKKKEDNPEDPLEPSVVTAVEKTQPIIDQWIETLGREIGKRKDYQAILDSLPALAKKLSTEDLGQVLQEENVIAHLMGLAEEPPVV